VEHSYYDWAIISSLEEAADLANHADTRTTRIYDRRDRVIRRSHVERIVF
jgi:hypothetical protein